MQIDVALLVFAKNVFIVLLLNRIKKNGLERGENIEWTLFI